MAIINKSAFLPFLFCLFTFPALSIGTSNIDLKKSNSLSKFAVLSASDGGTRGKGCRFLNNGHSSILFSLKLANINSSLDNNPNYLGPSNNCTFPLYVYLFSISEDRIIGISDPIYKEDFKDAGLCDETKEYNSQLYFGVTLDPDECQEEGNIFSVNLIIKVGILTPKGNLEPLSENCALLNSPCLNPASKEITFSTKVCCYEHPYNPDGKDDTLLSKLTEKADSNNSKENYLRGNLFNSLDQTLKSKDSTYSIYPNPFSESFLVDLSQPGSLIKQVNIFNSRGQKIISLVPRLHNSLSINLRDYPSGSYFVQIIEEREK